LLVYFLSSVVKYVVVCLQEMFMKKSISGVSVGAATGMESQI